MQLGEPVEHLRGKDVTPGLGSVALLYQCPMVDARLLTVGPQQLVLMVRPRPPPLAEKIVAIPFAGLHGPQALLGGLAQGERYMGMVIARIVAFRRNRPVNGYVCNHAAFYEVSSNEVPH